MQRSTIAATLTLLSLSAIGLVHESPAVASFPANDGGKPKR
jgi:hypothetical protein